MTTNSAPLVIDQYATFSTEVLWTDADGVVVDVTDFTAHMQIRNTYDNEVILDLTTEAEPGDDGIFFLEDGNIQIFITPTTTSTLDFIYALYDLVLTAPDDTVFRVAEGVCFFNKGVTHTEESP